jgi:aryl-alcohol dehydrogenase-like predicted oxidoreductase
VRYKILGSTGLKVSEIALGSGMFGQTWGYGASRDEVGAIIAAYADAGGNLLDTADYYQHGEAETIIGNVIAAHREDYVLVSKYSRGATAGPALARLGNNRKNMIESVEASLRRLGTDHIDIYFAHMDDLVTPMEEIARGLDDLVRMGKIVYAGLSNFPAWRIALGVNTAAVRGWTPVCAIQTEYNLLQRTAERELIPMAQGLQLAVMAWSPLSGGVLTGKYRSGETGRATNFPAVMRNTDDSRTDGVVDALIEIAAELGAAPAQVATAWVRAKGILPVVGARTRQQIITHLEGTAVSLSPDQLSRLDALTAIEMGVPHEMCVDPREVAIMTGGRSDLIDRPPVTVA